MRANVTLPDESARRRPGRALLAGSPVPGPTRRAPPGLRLFLLALAFAGCAPRGGPRPIAPGTPCAVCGMRIEDLRYACEAEQAGAFRMYDSIECMLRAGPPPARAWLADYDTRTLHPADSIWVVQADIPSPMGGGFAAFADQAAAAEIAASRSGRVGKLADFASGGASRDSAAGRP